MSDVFETKDIDAHRPASPRRSHLYFSVDTGEIRFAFTAGVWTVIYPIGGAAVPATVLPLQVDAGDAGAVGTGTKYAREDHEHPVNTAVAGDLAQIDAGDVAAAGTSAKLPRADHQHAVNTALVGDITTIGAKAAGTSGTLARGDHRHDLSAPSATATGDTTFTSATDVLIASMTLTPAAGTYLVWFNGSLAHSSLVQSTFLSIWAAGAQVAASERQFDTLVLNESWSFTSMAIVTVDGAQAIEGRGRTTSGTATVHERGLFILQIG